MLEHVVNACLSSARFVSRGTGVAVQVVLLVPHGDLITKTFRNIEIIEGDENDVLSRYKALHDLYKPDAIARVTGDCWAIASHALSRALKTMIALHESKGVGYVTNTDVMPLFEREVVEGYDSEVFTSEVLDWLCEQATEADEKEHVTIKIGRAIAAKTFPFRWCFLGDKIYPHSIDTPEQYHKVLELVNAQKEKKWSIIEHGGIYSS